MNTVYGYGALYLYIVTSSYLINKILLLNIFKSTDNSLVTPLTLNSNPGLRVDGWLWIVI